MKILYVITKSNWGGAQRYVYDLAKSFSKKGIECVVASGGDGPLFDKLTEKEVRTISIKSLARDFSLRKEFSVLCEMYHVIKEESPNVLHLNSSKAAGFGVLIGRMLKVRKIVVTMHGAPFREDRNPVSKAIIYFLTWLTCLGAHKIITVSKQDERDIGAMFFVRKKVCTIYLGITYEPKQERTLKKGRELKIVTIGEFTKNKGQLYGLQAIELLSKKGVSFSYTLIGEGEDRKKIEEYIKLKQLEDIVTLPGFQDARSVLHEYDIYFLPSVKEGLPYILLEAGKTSLPVVATITGGVPEIIRHEETGLLANSKDVHALAEALYQMIINRKSAKQFGQQLHSHIVQHFSYGKMLVETAQVYGLIEPRAIASIKKKIQG
jgi:glycosyltransferase involved in cell wall biosynthesis